MENVNDLRRSRVSTVNRFKQLLGVDPDGRSELVEVACVSVAASFAVLVIVRRFARNSLTKFLTRCVRPLLIPTGLVANRPRRSLETI
jgi:hypothetical protein